MSTLKSIFGAILILGGVLGIGLCCYVGVEIRGNAKHLRREIPETVLQIENVIGTVQTQGKAASMVLSTTRTQLKNIQRNVEQLSSDAPDAEITSLLHAWDEEISRSLVQAEEFVQAIQTSLHSATSALLLAESIPLFRPRRSAGAQDEPGDLQNLAEHLESIASMLEQVNRALVEIRSKRSVSIDQIRNLREVTRRLDGELALVQNEIELFTTRMKKLGKRLKHTRENSPRWIMNASTLSVAFLWCLALSQGVVVIQGCRWIKPEK